MQWTWGESWKSSEIITTKIEFTSRSMAVLRENVLANRRPPMPSLPTTLGGTIAAVCSRCRSQRNLRMRHGQLPMWRYSSVVEDSAMVLTKTGICAFSWKAHDFALKAVDGKIYSLAEVRGPKGTLVVFICNHCPYVRAIIGRLVAEVNALREIGIG